MQIFINNPSMKEFLEPKPPPSNYPLIWMFLCYNPHFQSGNLRSSLSWSMILKTNKVQQARSKNDQTTKKGRTRDVADSDCKWFRGGTPLVFFLPVRCTKHVGGAKKGPLAIQPGDLGWTISLNWCNCRNFQHKYVLGMEFSNKNGTTYIHSCFYTCPVADFQMKDSQRFIDAKCQVDDTAEAVSFQLKPCWS